jgi:hypothetical protein
MIAIIEIQYQMKQGATAPYLCFTYQDTHVNSTNFRTALYFVCAV